MEWIIREEGGESEKREWRVRGEEVDSETKERGEWEKLLLVRKSSNICLRNDVGKCFISGEFDSDFIHYLRNLKHRNIFNVVCLRLFLVLGVYLCLCYLQLVGIVAVDYYYYYPHHYGDYYYHKELLIFFYPFNWEREKEREREREREREHYKQNEGERKDENERERERVKGKGQKCQFCKYRTKNQGGVKLRCCVGRRVFWGSFKFKKLWGCWFELAMKDGVDNKRRGRGEWEKRVKSERRGSG